MTKHDLIRIENTIGSAITALDHNAPMALELARRAHRKLGEMLAQHADAAKSRDLAVDAHDTANAVIAAQAGLGKARP